MEIWNNSRASKTNQTDTEQKPSDTEQKPSDAKEKQSDAKEKQSNAETPKPNAETPKPRVIQYNIDGKQVYISSNDWPHFNELRAQLASGTTLNDDLIRKIKPILAELHL